MVHTRICCARADFSYLVHTIPGAGKSSLLDCISLRNHRFEGHVYLGKKPVDQHFFSTTAYVHQVDLFFATLTVREHLKFHAMVRVKKEVAVPDRLKRVEEVRGCFVCILCRLWGDCCWSVCVYQVGGWVGD